MSKTTEYRTKKKQAREATADEQQAEIIEFLKKEYAARAKAREIIEEYLDGKDQKSSKISN